jgi:hypothetical protein
MEQFRVRNGGFSLLLWLTLFSKKLIMFALQLFSPFFQKNTLSAFRDDFEGSIAPPDAEKFGIMSFRWQAAVGEAEVAGNSGHLDLGICTNHQLLDRVIAYESGSCFDLLWDDSQAWWSKFQHFMVFLHAVLGKLGRESSEFEWTRRQLKDLCWEEMMVTHGKMAFCVMHCIDSI